LIPIFVGLDHRESVGYHVFCHSVLARTKAEVAFYPVRGDKVVGSTQFNPGRFDVARNMGYRGWAIWAECDQIVLADLEEVMQYADPRCAVVVAKHDYKTKWHTKFLGQPNPDYPRKNWSSFMLINARHAAWERLQYKPRTLEELHRFAFIDEDRIGSLPLEWNWLANEYEFNSEAKLVHFTAGTPCWEPFDKLDYAEHWYREMADMLSAQGASSESLIEKMSQYTTAAA
jgi:lipopolysaccharide biosynthesis glycosyltransferase